jgi:hypothetical protein
MTSVNPKSFIYLFLICTLVLSACQKEDLPKESIPLPEHPRPDFERADWINLNGYWEFEFDGSDQGLKEGWFNGQKALTQKILVPFHRPGRKGGTTIYSHCRQERRAGIRRQTEGWALACTRAGRTSTQDLEGCRGAVARGDIA